MQAGTLELILQAGATGVLVLVLVGLFVLIKLVVPAGKEFLLGLVAEQRATTDALAKLREAMISEIRALTNRVDIAEAAIKAHSSNLAGSIASEVRNESAKSVTATGQHVALTVEHAVARVSHHDLDDGGRVSPTHARRPFRSHPGGAPLSSRQSVVLIVEDDPSSARMLQVLLNAELGVAASIASSCADAHAMLRPPLPLPKVAIIDLQLGDGFGVDLANELPRGVAVILVSGTIEKGMLGKLAKGVTAHTFEKPIKFDALVAKVKELLEE